MKIKKISISESQRKAILESAGKDSGLTLESVDRLSDQIEASMNSKIVEIAKVIRSEAAKHFSSKYKTLATEAVKRNNQATMKRVDLYLEYAVKNFFKKNQLAIEHSISSVRDKRIVEGVLSLMKENYFSIPEGKDDVVKELGRYAAKMEKLAESKDSQLKSTQKSFIQLKKNAMVEAASRNLTDTQRTKLQEWAKNFSAKSMDHFKASLLEARSAVLAKANVAESAAQGKSKVTLAESSNGANRQSFAPKDDLISRSASVLRQ